MASVAGVTQVLGAADGGAVSDELIALATRVQKSVVLVRSGERGAGAGVIWRSDGIVLTNHHVVAGRQQVAIVLSDDREFPATVIASEPALDLAILKVAGSDLPVLRATQRQPRVGQLVLAVGNPWGERGIVTMGIVSGCGEVQVPWRKQAADYIRSDVRLAPGNSGGPLLDANGDVVGINAMIFGGDLSVAIPTQVVRQYLELVERQPKLGVGVRSNQLPAPVRAQVRQDRALEVLALVPDGPAGQAGLGKGDWLVALDGEPLTDPESLQSALGRHQVGARIPLQIIRDGVLQTRTVELRGLPGVQQAVEA